MAVGESGSLPDGRRAGSFSSSVPRFGYRFPALSALASAGDPRRARPQPARALSPRIGEFFRTARRRGLAFVRVIYAVASAGQVRFVGIFRPHRLLFLPFRPARPLVRPNRGSRASAPQLWPAGLVRPVRPGRIGSFFLFLARAARSGSGFRRPRHPRPPRPFGPIAPRRAGPADEQTPEIAAIPPSIPPIAREPDAEQCRLLRVFSQARHGYHDRKPDRRQTGLVRQAQASRPFPAARARRRRRRRGRHVLRAAEGRRARLGAERAPRRSPCPCSSRSIRSP